MTIAIYPGTFDPITNGHLDVIRRCSCLFDRLIVAVSYSQDKTPFFSIEERVQMIKEATVNYRKVAVDSFGGLLVEYARKKKARVVVRGLRAVSDFEYEFQMALMNRKLAPEMETVFVMPSEKYTYLNSTVVKEIATLGGSIKGLVPSSIERKLKERLSEVRCF